MMRGMFAAISGLQVPPDDARRHRRTTSPTSTPSATRASRRRSRTRSRRPSAARSAGSGARSAAPTPTRSASASSSARSRTTCDAGAIQTTGNPLDLAIQGDGFFRVARRRGGRRHLGCELHPRGQLHARRQRQPRHPGRPVRDRLPADHAGHPGGLRRPGQPDQASPSRPAASRSRSARTAPSSYVDAAGVQQLLGTISMAKFPNASGVERVSGNLFRESSNSGAPVTGGAGRRDDGHRATRASARSRCRTSTSHRSSRA